MGDDLAQQPNVRAVILSDGLLGAPWLAWGGVCLVVAVVYSVVWPRPKQPVSMRPLWRHLVLRWAHALVWLLLAGSCFLRMPDWPGSVSVANALAPLALLVYASFLATLAVDRIQRR
jgi:hypothetical protein